MSKEIAVQSINLVKKQEQKFRTLDKANGQLLDFEKECLFARQQLLKNDFTLKVAGGNPSSLQAAILNVAAIGISLNPAQQHAYLVPRDGSICLDISFRGLTYLATESGAIKWAKVELVYEADTFAWCGPAEMPKHEADPFSDRGEIKGGYCIAKLPDDSVMVEVMPIAEIHKIRDTSKAYSKKGGPWINWFEEMAKKTILKRAAKSWPQTPNRRRVDAAVEVLHQSEGSRYTLEQHEEYMRLLKSEDALGFYLMRLRIGTDTWAALFNSGAYGEKTKMKDAARKLEQAGANAVFDYCQQMNELAEQGDDVGFSEIAEIFAGHEKHISHDLSPEAWAMLDRVEKAA